METDETTIGIISDTHSLLRTDAVAALKGSALIVHAGDFDTPEVLAEIKRLAPLLAARGNMDRGSWAEDLAVYDLGEAAGKTLGVVHNLEHLPWDPSAAGVDVVVSGHTHLPAVFELSGVLYINPGSAGPQRSGKPLSVARLVIRAGKLIPEIILLDE